MKIRYMRYKTVKAINMLVEFQPLTADCAAAEGEGVDPFLTDSPVPSTRPVPVNAPPLDPAAFDKVYILCSISATLAPMTSSNLLPREKK